MSINLTDALRSKAANGKLADAEQIFLEGDTQNVQNEIKGINSRHDTLSKLHESLSDTVQKISATGKANTATEVTYNNTNSGIVAENIQDAVDKLAAKDATKAEKADVTIELGKKLDKTSISQESGEAEDKVMSQKAVSTKLSGLSNTKSGSFGWEYGHINPSTNAIIYGDKTRLINNVPLPKIGSIKLKEGYLVASCFELTALGNLSNYTSVNNISHSWKTKYGVVLVVKKANGDEEFEGTTGFLETLVDDSNKEFETELSKKADSTTMTTELGKKLDKTSISQESGEAEDKVMSQKAVSTKLSGLSNTKSGSFGWEYGHINPSTNAIIYGDKTRLINNVPLPKIGSIKLKEGYLVASCFELTALGNLSNYTSVNNISHSWKTKYGVVLVVKKANGDEEFEGTTGFLETLVDDSNKEFETETYNTIGSPELYNQPSLEDTKDFRLYDTISSWYEAWDNLATQYPDWLKREDDIGKDESGKYEMRHYTLRMQHPTVTADRQGNGENKWDDSLFKYRHILINMGMHTDEKYAMLGSFLAIKNLLESNANWARFIKNNFVLDIIPCACPWGLENNYNGEYGLNMNGVNINRDFANKSAAETRNIIGLVEKLLPLGLVGIIDTHNTGLGDGYFVCKKTYTHYNYYCLLTQMVNANLYHLFAQVFTNGKKSHFHTWNYESEAASVGQFHWYADQIGVLGCTMEIAIAAGFKGSLLTKSVLLNLITSFGTYRF